jgi:microcystin-dependent protein
MFDSGGRVYRAFVKSSDFLTGEIIVTIPNLFGEEDGLSISYIGRQSYFNDIFGMYTWKVPSVGTVIAVASDDDQFSNLIWVDTDHESWDIQHNKNFALNPPGAILPYAGDENSIPVGYFLCDGGAFDGVVHSDLANIVGDKYGTHIGDNYFLPNLKGKVVVGLDSSQLVFNALGKTGGSSTHLLTTTEMPSHTHTQDQHTHVQNQHTHTQNEHTHTQNEHTHTQNVHNHLVWIDTDEQGNHRHTYDYENTGSVFRGLSSPVSSTASVANTANSNTGYAGTHKHTIFGYSADQTATNQNTTATNQNTTATNQNTTPTNQNTTATNQSTGGSGAHNNLQPYIVLNYIIKY